MLSEKGVEWMRCVIENLPNQKAGSMIGEQLRYRCRYLIYGSSIHRRLERFLKDARLAGQIF